MATDEFHKRRTLPGLPQDVKIPDVPVEIPKMIGPYKIEGLIEKGGMSVLYLGIHPETQELTTIKVLSTKYLSNPDVVQRFLTEAEIVAMADHPNIVKLYGHGEWAGGLYIAMEYIQGISLRQVLLQRPISLKRALEIIIDIAYALCHLHTHGVIHRDLKPENILITETDQVKVIDFGIAQLLTEKNASGTSSTQRLIGTPIYMSPEQRQNPEKVSYPSDIYSLGIIAYELVLGKLSHGQIHLALMPKGLQKIFNKALQPMPQDRYHDVVDFITDISSYLNSTNLEKEKKAGDQLSEISENLRNVLDILLPPPPQNWKNVEISLGIHKGLEIFGIFYDFFTFPDGSFGIMMGESSSKGPEGIVYVSMLRGMLFSLIEKSYKPSDLATALNKLIIKDKQEKYFAFSFLLLKPDENRLAYVSCGQNHLWKIPALTKIPTKISVSNIALGIDIEATFPEVNASWEVGDSLLLSSFAADSKEENIDVFFEKALKESGGNMSTQKIVDAILRKAKISISKSLLDRSLSLIGLVRHS